MDENTTYKQDPVQLHIHRYIAVNLDTNAGRVKDIITSSTSFKMSSNPANL